MRRFTNSRRTLVGLVLMATLGIAACSANHAPSAAGSGNGHCDHSHGHGGTRFSSTACPSAD